MSKDALTNSVVLRCSTTAGPGTRFPKRSRHPVPEAQPVTVEDRNGSEVPLFRHPDGALALPRVLRVFSVALLGARRRLVRGADGPHAQVDQLERGFFVGQGVAVEPVVLRVESCLEILERVRLTSWYCRT